MYSVVSVLDALRSIKDVALENAEGADLECHEGPRCPLPKEKCPHYENPDGCEKGNKQSCKQPVTVFYKKKKLQILFFRFKISISNRNGFIPKDDSALNSVIKYCQVDKSSLKSP